MARISTYALDAAINDADKLIGTDSDNNNQTKNFSLLGIAEYVIDTFIDPDASDFQIPVFNQNGIRITGSIMSQDSSPSNGVAGTKITIAGDLTLERDQSDTTLTLVSDTSNIGEQNNPSIKFFQDGNTNSAAVGFNIIDDTSGGTIPGSGNKFWIVGGMDDNVGEGGIVFGTSRNYGWENAVSRFIIRTDGKGLFGHPDSLYTKTLGSQFEIYDNRNENTTTDPSFTVYSVLDFATLSGTGGAGGIKQILDVYDNGVFQQQESIMLIPGTTSSDFAASTPLAFYTNSNMDTSNPSGFAGMIFDSGNWLLDGAGAFTTTDPGYQLKVAGNTNITGDAQIDTLTNNYIPVNNAQGVLRDSGFYQVSAPSLVDKAIGLNTTYLDSSFGEYPDFRVASRSLNDPGVLDLFRPDGDVVAGDRVGILQYSVDDDNQYTVAQIEVKTIGNSGTGNSGGGKLCIKTSSNQNGAQPTERLCIDNTEADFSVPINVTDLNRSSFAGQVTIPETPVSATDAASKAYVDSQNAGQVSGSGTANRLTYWTTESAVDAVSDFEVVNSKKLRITPLNSDLEGIIEGQGEGGVSWIKFGPNPRIALGGGAVQYDKIVTLGGSGIGVEQNVLTVKTTAVGSEGPPSHSYQVNIGTNIEATQTRTTLSGNLRISANVLDSSGSTPSVNDSVLVGDTSGELTWKSKDDLDVIEGSGNQYNIPVYTSSRELSGLTASTGLPSSDSLTAGITTQYIGLGAQGPGSVPTEHTIKNYNASGSTTSTYLFNQSGIFTVSGDNGGRIDVGVDPANISGTALNVGTGVATFKGGVIISNSPGGVQVDNSSLVVGSGTNDNISGSDHCLIVGSGNQITSNSDQSVAFGQGNAITASADAFAVGNSNTVTSSLRTQALGFNNTVTASSSFVAGGGNSINANSNIFALGDGHTVTTAATQDAYLFGTANTITGGTGSFAIGSNLDGDTGNHMVVGYRNNKTSYPATDYSLGLGNTKFALSVGSTTTTNSNALLITEGGVNRGGGVAQVPRIILPQQETLEFASDTDATAGGIPTGGLYRNGNDLKINFNETAAGGNEGLAYLTPQLLTASAAASGTIDPNYNLVLLSWTGGNGVYTLNLPLASANTNRLIRITTDGSLASGAGDKINITATGGETIDGDPSFQISKQYEGLAVFSTGSEWLIVQAKAH